MARTRLEELDLLTDEEIIKIAELRRLRRDILIYLETIGEAANRHGESYIERMRHGHYRKVFKV